MGITLVKLYNTAFWQKRLSLSESWLWETCFLLESSMDILSKSYRANFSRTHKVPFVLLPFSLLILTKFEFCWTFHLYLGVLIYCMLNKNLDFLLWSLLKHYKTTTFLWGLYLLDQFTEKLSKWLKWVSPHSLHVCRTAFELLNCPVAALEVGIYRLKK